MKIEHHERLPSMGEGAELDAHLRATPSAMSPQMAEGFITAIASTPLQIPEDEWVPVALGMRDAQQLDEHGRLASLLIRSHQHVRKTLNDGITGWPSDDLEAGELREWCQGYLTGTRMDRVWQDDMYAVSMLFRVGVLAGEMDLVGEEDDQGNVIEDDTKHLERYREEMQGVVLDAHGYWHGRQMSKAAGQTVPKIGRNEPCPCGSGAKFKRCCGRG